MSKNLALQQFKVHSMWILPPNFALFLYLERQGYGVYVFMIHNTDKPSP